jgi:hypothetical protein
MPPGYFYDRRNLAKNGKNLQTVLSVFDHYFQGSFNPVKKQEKSVIEISPIIWRISPHPEA